ncbi:MAG: DUF4870 domain-containing protein [Candidatus Sumerlaeaceae bacterium]
MSRYDELQKLQELKSQGVLSEEEFQTEKQRLLNSPEPASTFSNIAPPPPPPFLGATPSEGSPTSTDGKIWGMEPNVYCMLLHLSQFAGFMIPFLGLALPIVMWAVNKEQSAEVDAHGKVVLNWLITELIAGFVFFLLCFVFIGVPLLILLVFCGILFAIIGAIKANDGQVWPYPGSIRFL